MITITLRGQQFTSDVITRIESLALISLFYPGATAQEQIETMIACMDTTNPLGIDLENPADRNRAVLNLCFHLKAHKTKAQTADAICSIFPSINPEWVSYTNEDNFRFKLEPDGVVHIITEVLKGSPVAGDPMSQAEKPQKAFISKPQPKSQKAALR